jgi:DNA-binding transcriptional LysR family regulator
MINWDDMRVFIAVARSGSFSTAGRRIGMNATTVARRTQRLESNLKATLFTRSRHGLQLTGAGMRLAEAGAGVEAAVSVAGNESTLNPAAGTVRISAPDGFASSILVPAIASFVEQHPGLQFELVPNASYLSPSTREVDIAISSQPPVSARLVVERLSDYELGLYGARDYLARRGMPRNREELTNFDFVGFVDDLLYSDAIRFLDGFAPKLSCRITSSSIRSQAAIAASGGGIGAFPHFLAREFPALVPVLPDLKLVRTLWVATHHELFETLRIKTVRQWLLDLVGQQPHILMPSCAITAAGLRSKSQRRTLKRA